MKRGQSIASRPLIGRASGVVAAIVFLVRALAVPMSAAPSDAAADPKTFTLFLGTELSVERDHAFHRVEDVKGASFVVEIGGAEVRVPMSAGSVNLKFDQSLKLTRASANVDKLKYDRAYTPGNDPYIKFQRNQELQSEAINSSALAEGSMTSISQKLQIVGAGQTLQNVQGGPAAEANKMLSTFENGVANANLQQGGQGAASTGSMDFQTALAEELFDAIEVSFEASAEKPMADPYLVVIARYRERSGKPGVSRNWIYAIPLEPLSVKPVKVHFLQGGLPQGFEIENFQVHIYDRGEEVATNVAPKHMALTRDQAYQYMTVDYVLGHKEATLPAAPSFVDLPIDLRLHVTDSQLNRTVYVRVSKGGSGAGLYLDSAGRQKADDPFLDSVVKFVHFNPALDKGKPVEAVCAFRLGQVLK
jgi:hypothetical protein